MKTGIVYYSKHHGNTRRVLDAIAAECGVTLIDATGPHAGDLSGYDLIGFASGIYFSKFHSSVLRFAQRHLPEGRPVFFLYTCGADKAGYTDAIRRVVSQKSAEVLGSFGCLGFDTFGPFRLVGGIAKGHPDQSDLRDAVQFYRGIAK